MNRNRGWASSRSFATFQAMFSAPPFQKFLQGIGVRISDGRNVVERMGNTPQPLGIRRPFSIAALHDIGAVGNQGPDRQCRSVNVSTRLESRLVGNNLTEQHSSSFPANASRAVMQTRCEGLGEVPGARLELARCRQRWILSPLRLPIPPSRQVT